jgi:hypothetical protein
LQYLEGRIFREPLLPGLPAGERRAVYLEAARTLAKARVPAQQGSEEC